MAGVFKKIVFSIQGVAYFLCDPSQKGFLDDFPHLQSHTSDPDSTGNLFSFNRVKSPLTLRGPSFIIVITGIFFFPSIALLF